MTGKIYLIRNLVNGKGYVGQTKRSLFVRFSQHKKDAEKRSDTALHRALRKYGPENFEIKEVATCDCALLDDLEKHYVEFYGTYAPTGHGYNLTIGGSTGPRERVVSEEGKRKLSEVHKGNSYAKGHAVSDEARALMSSAQKDREHRSPSEEERAKISATLKGHLVSEETRAKISEVQKGKKRGPLSDEAKIKIGNKNRGRKLGPLSEEQKRQRSIAQKGKKKSPEAIAKRTATRAKNGFTLSGEARTKISETLSGKPHTEEQKAKQSEGLRNWWAKRKEIG